MITRMQLDTNEQLTQAINPAQFFRFASVDLAPNDALETGFSAVDRDRTMVRVDKVYTDEQIVNVVLNMGPPPATLVLIDMPKSLSIPNRWQQEQVKMHPFRLTGHFDKSTRLDEDTQDVDRFERRGRRLYDAMLATGCKPLLYFNYWTRMNYDLLLPFRSRSPMGCRTLQAGIEDRLQLKQMPTNLSPSSVLESMVGAYAAWSVWGGKAGEDFEVAVDSENYEYLIALDRPHVKSDAKPRRRFKRYKRRYR
ncbi:MAG: hypothetical protein KC462_00255 [Cyanobacteria bacterium HKST-UBA05]|nr:hypothetical protein [Cyanobacteria bacterium HKST-UBA05]